MDLLALLIYIQMTLYALTAFTALLYACFILFIPRFHNTSNIFIANICLSITVSTTYFTSYFPTMISMYYTPYLCVFYTYAFNVTSIAIPFSFVAFTVHRFCVIMYHQNSLFKKKRWTIICIIGFWIIQLVLSLPFIAEYDEFCNMKIWMGYYTFFFALVAPMVIKSVLDIRIFIYVRRSTLRVQPQRMNVVVSGTSNHQPRISRRDLTLLKNMIFTFLMFILGWTPVLLLSLIDLIIPGHIFQIIYCMYLSILCSFSIVIYLFIYNRELKQFLFHRIRRCFQH